MRKLILFLLISVSAFSQTIPTGSTSVYPLFFKNGTALYLQGIGSVPRTWQETLNVNAITTTSPTIKGVPLYIQNSDVSAFCAITQTSTELSINSNKKILLGSGSTPSIDIYLNGGVAIPITHGIYTNILPNANGVIPVTVNGQSADAAGNITISTGGTGTVTSVTGDATGGLSVANGTTTPALTMSAGSATQRGTSRLYNTVSGTNTDGAADQNSVNTALGLKANLSGGNTFVGDQTFSNNILFSTNNTLNIGTSSIAANTAYAYRVQSPGALALFSGTGGIALGAGGVTAIQLNSTRDTFYSSVTGGVNLGNTTFRWGNYFGGSADFTGNVLIGTTPTLANHAFRKGDFDSYQTISAATTTQTAASLNASYPSAPVFYRVYAPNVGTGMIYVKTTVGGQWLAQSCVTLN